MGEFKNGTIGMTSGKITTRLYRKKKKREEENKHSKDKVFLDFKDKMEETLS